ncbi:MAG: NADH oxidase [Spirochaetae bacterium HGW-Spirochaetae-6]|nr:MAG: NADH oxidase [Spirochaetae bacterium HGW-Spirochaetae-6]
MRHEVTHIHRDRNKVTVRDLSNDTVFDQEYEKLIIGTGARAQKPDMPGTGLAGIYFMKQLQDALDIREFIKKEKPRRVVIMGGGYIGLEASEAFGRLDMDVTLVEARPRIMEIMDEDMSEVIADEMRKRSVKILTGRKVIGFEGNGRVREVLLDDGHSLEADFVLTSIGVVPNSEIAGEAGLELGEKSAVKVDEYLKTNDPDIYAAGDCSLVFHRVLKEYVYIPLALGSNRQGRMCGENIVAELAGKQMKPFPGILGTAVTKYFDCEIGKTGIGQTEIKRYNLEHIGSVKVKAGNLPGYYPGASDMWVKLFFEDDSKILVGGQIVGKGGSVLRLDAMVAAISARMSLNDVYSLDMVYAPPFSTVWNPILIAARIGMR